MQPIVYPSQVHCWGHHVVALGCCLCWGLLGRPHGGQGDIVSETTGCLVPLPFPGLSGSPKLGLCCHRPLEIQARKSQCCCEKQAGHTPLQSSLSLQFRLPPWDKLRDPMMAFKQLLLPGPQVSGPHGGPFLALSWLECLHGSLYEGLVPEGRWLPVFTNVLSS